MPIADAAVGAAARVGPYFSVTSFVPAAIIVAVITPLIAASPWTGQPDWEQAAQKLSHPSLVQVGGFFALVMLLALALHPLQYGLVQLMEGYWGTRKLALCLASRRVGHHAGMLTRLQEIESLSRDGAYPLGAAAEANRDDLVSNREASRLLRRYPEDLEDLAPTALGNILRRYERGAGRPYGLDIITAAPHLLLVAKASDVAYVRDQRTQLDLATRLSASCLAVSVVSALLLAPCGWWMLLAVVPYLLAQMFYRGACVVAQEYGVSLNALIDLNRNELYARLGVPAPRTLQSEREQNESLNKILTDRDVVQLRLIRPEVPSSSSPGVPRT